MERDDLRVLIINAWDGTSGVLTVFRALAERLKPRGVRFDSFCYNGWTPNSRWKEFCEELYSNFDVSLTELLVREKFDVVHLVDTACNAAYRPDVWLKRARFNGGVVCMSQNTIAELEPGQKAHVFIACSESSRQIMARTVTAPIRVIFNGADTAFFRPREVATPLRPILAWVGRTADLRQKDIFAFVALIARLYDSPYDFWIADAGTVPESLRLADWFGDRVRYQSGLDREALARFYSSVAASGGAVVSTSTFEGLPLALVEAAACGCAVIAPRAPGFEYIEDGQTGLLYDRQNALAGILRCLETLKNTERRHAMTHKALTSVQELFNSNKMAEQYFQAYNDSIADSAKQSPRGGRISARAWSAALAAQRIWRNIKSGRPRTPAQDPAPLAPLAAPAQIQPNGGL